MSQASPPPEPGTGEAAPVCPQHPDRETRISCTRCGRPICHECMVTAPVGFQCRSCVAEGAKTAPVYQGAAVVQAKAAGATPYVAYTLVGICVAAFLLSYAVGGINVLAADFAMRPIYIALDGEYYRLITDAFLHWSILHIAFNMLVLILLGPPLERLLGHVRFSVLYLLAAFGGSVASYVFSPLNTVSVGASGAIFGLMAALIVAGRHLRVDITQVAILLGINLVIGFIPGGSIDWRAHLGGLVVGAAVAAVIAYAPKSQLVLFQTLGVLAIFVVLVAAAGWRTQEIRSEFTAPPTTPVLTTQEQSGTLELVTNHQLGMVTKTKFGSSSNP